jgi:head-tail adaptor
MQGNTTLQVTSKERPWLTLTSGSLGAMLTICEKRNRRYWDEKKIEKWARNRDLWASVERELASRN